MTKRSENEKVEEMRTKIQSEYFFRDINKSIINSSNIVINGIQYIRCTQDN